MATKLLSKWITIISVVLHWITCIMTSFDAWIFKDASVSHCAVCQLMECLRLYINLHLTAYLPWQIPEYCRVLEESEISEHCFDLIFAFDEIVALGYRENVNLAQIRTFTEMDSHEEKVFRAVREVRSHYCICHISLNVGKCVDLNSIVKFSQIMLIFFKMFSHLFRCFTQN